MLLAINWNKYSLVVGFLKKTTEISTSPIFGNSDVSGNGRPVRPRVSWIGLRIAKIARIALRIVRTHSTSSVNEAVRQDLLFRLAHLLIRELRSGIRESADKQQNKEELLRSLGLLLKPYTPLKYLPFRIAINNFISMETDSCCSFHLNDEELLMLWREVS